MYTLPRTATLAELKECLTRANVLWETWREHGRKTVEELHEEVRSGVSELKISEEGPGPDTIERELKSIVIDVCARAPENKLRTLREKRPDGADGMQEARTRHTVCMKIAPEQDRRAVAEHCVRDKLGYRGPFAFVKITDNASPVERLKRYMCEHAGASEAYLITRVHTYERDDEDPSSYPGLPTLREFRYYLCMVPDSADTQAEVVRGVGGEQTTYRWEDLGEDEGRPLSSERVFSKPVD